MTLSDPASRLRLSRPALAFALGYAVFDMAFKNKLFVPFQRLHAGGDFQGVGLGLAGVRRIVQRHGGRIWAEAKPGEGATFFFELPTA